MSTSILEIPMQPKMTIREAVYIQNAVKQYCKSLKACDEKDILLLWLRQLENFLSDKTIIQNLPDSF